MENPTYSSPSEVLLALIRGVANGIHMPSYRRYDIEFEGVTRWRSRSRAAPAKADIHRSSQG